MRPGPRALVDGRACAMNSRRVLSRKRGSSVSSRASSAEQWEASNVGDGYKPLRDLIGKLYGHSNATGGDTNTGRTMLHRATNRSWTAVLPTRCPISSTTGPGQAGTCFIEECARMETDLSAQVSKGCFQVTCPRSSDPPSLNDARQFRGPHQPIVMFTSTVWKSGGFPSLVISGPRPHLQLGHGQLHGARTRCLHRCPPRAHQRRKARWYKCGYRPARTTKTPSETCHFASIASPAGPTSSFVAAVQRCEPRARQVVQGHQKSRRGERLASSTLHARQAAKARSADGPHCACAAPSSCDRLPDCCISVRPSSASAWSTAFSTARALARISSSVASWIRCSTGG